MELDPNTPVVLNMNLGKTNLILGALSKLPYEQSAGLIQDIQQQTVPQVTLSQKETNAENPVPTNG